MSSFRIKGGSALKGEIIPQGAKNEALQIISATLLTAEPVTLHKIPNIRDVNKLIELIGDMGAEVEKLDEESYRITAKEINVEFLESKEYKEKAASLRGSIMILGPLLARYGKAKIPKPGGDKIGRRRLDTHFLGFQALGAKFNYSSKDAFYSIDATDLNGKYIHLDEASVTGTANIIMAAVLSKGTTTLYNAACEPYIQQLCRMLNRMGAKISGLGSNLLHIEGVKQLGGTEHTLLPDMIEVGSFIGLAAMTQSEITIKGAGVEHLGLIPEVFRRLGIQMVIQNDDIIIPAQKHYEIDTFIDGSIMTVADAPWPGFTPDLLSIVLVTAIQAKGTVLVHQKMFESRLFFVDKLIDMGAQIILCDPHRATVIGLDRKQNLRGIKMSSPDIRAGVSLLIAALSAEGESVISNVEQIDRGYQNIDARLKALGANIERLD
ncbi:UDP-N-acetylglucosamine 1-carboxyvinyltransferase [Fulvivirga sedimenti]|uniref:UDP-N-acetylglucosamine 1-carboxyvinyltransferase n=1 Tax=Fulvivirga sedimenti TaxID=2879465 RepID=A0A9X1KYQ0_9BACT|nr:UDP-N-acetylglucosamine 1-carboxyvinyltransferase [Fulvivirga sedimenti]MCA6073846.1 UDP-N-acetylglucosamine 1-carboxyvinyltransferase [Fulvivirga sedimenti]